VQVSLGTTLHQKTQHLVAQAVKDGFASRLKDLDSTLWGPEAQEEASIRLEWAMDPSPGFELIGVVQQLREQLVADGITRFILCGMGGSSLAPEVMAQQFDVPLVVLDQTHPDVLASLVNSDLSDAAVIVSSKSGGTVETDSQRRALAAAFVRQGIDPVSRIIVVTDPGSPLDLSSRESGYRVFAGNPHIGGRFSALSAFGLVPGTLIGGDTESLLADAVGAWEECFVDSPENPALLLGAGIAAGGDVRNKLLLKQFPQHPGLGDWIEQLVAESTGKQGKGIVPVVESSQKALNNAVSIGPQGSTSDIEIEATLGQHFVLWMVATAFACQILGVNPFDQPNVESAKVATRALLSGGTRNRLESQAVQGGAIWQSATRDRPITEFADVSRAVLELLEPHGYLALLVFGGDGARSRWAPVAARLETQANRPVTLGVGPRYLHSTGQLHKGGKPEGVYLIVVEKPEQTVAIEGREFDFGTLMQAQAEGDATVLAATGQPVLVVWTETPDDTQKLMDALVAGS